MSEEDHFRRQAVSGVKWISLSTLLTSAFQYLQVAVLTKFLNAPDFGIMAMALVVVGLAQAFTDVGISNAVIQHQDVKKDNISSLFWLEIAAGAILFMLMVTVTPGVVAFYNEPRLTWVMIWSSTIFLVTPWGQLFQILLQKELEFRKMAMIDISSSLLSTIVMIVAALAGFRVMALVIGQVSFYGLRSLQYFLVGWHRWRPALHFAVRDISGYIGFGLYQMGERTVTYLSINVINLIIGRYLGPGALGHYSLAYQLTITPLLRANTVLMQVSFPIFARFQHINGLLQAGYLRMARLISFTMFPVLVLTFLTAPVFVPLLLGPQWSDVIPLVQILSIVGILRALGAPTVPTYLAKGRADIGFTWNFILAIVNGIVFYIMTRYGLIALTWSFAAISLLQFVLMQTITGRLIHLKWIDFLRALSMNTMKNVVMGTVVYGIYLAGTSLKMGNLELFVVMLIAGLITYFAIAWKFSRRYLVELWGFLWPGRS